MRHVFPALRKLEKMSWAEMNAVFAASFVTEPDELQHAGGSKLVRHRVAGLSEDVRNTLREALASPISSESTRWLPHSASSQDRCGRAFPALKAGVELRVRFAIEVARRDRCRPQRS